MPRRSATPAGLSVAGEKAFIACRAAGVYTLGQQAMLGTVPDRPLQGTAVHAAEVSDCRRSA